MPNSNDRLWLEFGVFDDNNFGLYDCSENERINVYLKAGEKMYFGMKMNTEAFGGNGFTNPAFISFRIIDPDGQVFHQSTTMKTSGAGYIANYTQAITGPTGAILNGTPISGGYTPITKEATKTGNYSIEFQSWRNSHSNNGDNTKLRRRFALEFFDVTVTDALNNIVTNAGEPNKSAGRLWSKGWSFTTTSFTAYPVNAHFYVFTSDEFINKVNFKLYPYSFTFVANHFGVTALANEQHYIKRTQSSEGDQTIDGIQEYNVFLNDPDRIVWPNTTMAPPRVQVWGEEELFLDYKYNRDPLYLPLDYSNVVLEKNRQNDCPYDDVTFFKIESNLDGYTAILIDVDKDGEYSSDGNDRVIYRKMKKGLNYILWNFKNDNGAEVANGSYTASATFLGRGPAHFPLYDVERLDGITTSSVRPFNKLQTTLYWDDTPISRWGDETGAGQMDATQKKQLVIDNHVPRIWSWNSALENTAFNGNMNTMNTWFNAIDLGYGNIGIVVQESGSKCVDGSAPWVGDVYLEGPKNTPIPFEIGSFDYKFFQPNESPLSAIRIVSLPNVGTLLYNGSPAYAAQEIARTNVGLISYVPPADYHGKTSFIWKGRDDTNWSNNQENVYLIINTPPTISPIDDQNLCTNSNTSISFTVSDAETPASELVVTGFSAFPEFVPHSGIVISGTGENRTVTVNPVAHKSGKAIIYIMVDDGLSQVIEEFAVTVSPSLEFTGDTIVCVGEDLYLVAEEFGANSYSWKYNGLEVSNQRDLQQSAGGVDIGDWTLTIVKTIEGNTCTSTRNFTVEVSPLTTFTGDLNVCVGEEISLTATEVNATSYIWSRGTTPVSTQRRFSKASASLADEGSDYTLYVNKDGCENTSQPFTITVKNQPNTGLLAQGNTVDPGKDGTITINNTENDVTYVVYKNGNFVTSTDGPGNISIIIDALNLELGDNEFTIQADNGNCSVEFPQPVYITVNQPGIVVNPLTLTTHEDGNVVTFTVVLETEPSRNVVIPISSSNTNEGTVSPSSLTFTPANWATSQTVTVTPVRDWVVDGDQIYTIVLAPATGTDTYYSGIDADDVTVTNIDVDVAAVTVTGTNLETTEAGGTDQFTLVLTSKPSANVTITFSGVNTSEGTLSDNSILFTPGNWDTPQTVIVTGVDDDIDDGDVHYTINMSSSSGDGNFNGLTIASVSVVNRDDDTAGVSVFPISGLVTTEAGQTASFTVELNTIPTGSVVISLASSNVDEGTVSPSTLTFSASNWNAMQTVTITGADDLVDDGDQLYQVNLTINEQSTDDEFYKVVSIPSVSVTNKDDLTPRPKDDTEETDQEDAVIIDVLSNDLGLDYAPVLVSIASQPAQGVAKVNPDNTITYTPNRYYHGDFTFTYSVCNSLENCAQAGVTITVNRVDVTPIANDDFRGTLKNTLVEVDVLFNDENLYDLPILVSLVGSASPSGTVEVTTTNTVIFTPAANYVGEATFTYRVTDNDGDFDEALVTINVKEENHNPIANNDNVTVIQNTPKDINVLANDSGLEDGFGSMSIHSQPTNGTVSINDNRTINYSPNTDFIGDDTFEYFIEDIDGDNDIATVYVEVIERPNAIPVAVPDFRATEMDTPITADVLFNDYGLEDGVANVNIASSPANGTVEVNSDFTITYTPNSGYLGTETFMYLVCDVDGDCSNAALVTILVKPTGTNHIPVAVDDNASTFVNTLVDIDVLSNDYGLEDGFGSLEIHQQPILGSAEVVEDNLIRFIPANFYMGNMTFTYRLSDVDGDYDIATVTVRVIDINNPKPIANDDRVGTSYNTTVTIDVLANDTGLEDEPITVTILSAPNAAEGSAVVNSDNSVDFTPATNFVGVATFTYLVTDANGDQDDAKVEVTVKEGENYIPIANDDFTGTSLNTPVVVDVLENDTNLNDEPITVTISVQCNPAFGMAVVNSDNTITFTPANDYFGFASFIYTVTDTDGDYDNALVSVTVKDGQNFTPGAVDDVAYTHMEVPVEIDVLANDTGLADYPITVYVNQIDVSNGNADVLDNNLVRFTPANGFVGESTFKYRVVDKEGDFDEALVTIHVYSEVIAVDDNMEVMRNESVIVDVLANDQGIESIIPEVSIFYTPSHGMAIVNPDNTVTYTPNLDYFGDDAFEYKVCSQYGYCSEAKVNFDVKIEKFRIPEGFSPDGDGINDNFEIIGIEVYRQVKIKVFNRWGNIVYKNDNYKNNWDGKANASMSVGKTLPNGTYYYLIEIVDTKEKLSGNVFLKR